MGLFEQLEQQDFFQTYVSKHFSDAPGEVIQDFDCDNTVNADRVSLAFSTYTQSIKSFRVLLESENPDHYKRSGALLHALYKSKIVTDIAFGKSMYGTMEEVEADHPLGISFSDAQGMLRLPTFYKDYYNQLLSFDLAYQCCASYEDDPRPYNFNFLHNICYYLWKNEDLSVDSFAMIFRSLMH